MTQSSNLRSFATTAEFVAGLVPRLATYKAMTKSEAEHLVAKLRSGAEVALDVAAKMEKARDDSELLGALKDVLPILEAVRYTAGLRGNQVERMERAAKAVKEAEAALTSGKR